LQCCFCHSQCASSWLAVRLWTLPPPPRALAKKPCRQLLFLQSPTPDIFPLPCAHRCQTAASRHVTTIAVSLITPSKRQLMPTWTCPAPPRFADEWLEPPSMRGRGVKACEGAGREGERSGREREIHTCRVRCRTSRRRHSRNSERGLRRCCLSLPSQPIPQHPTSFSKRGQSKLNQASGSSGPLPAPTKKMTLNPNIRRTPYHLAWDPLLRSPRLTRLTAALCQCTVQTATKTQPTAIVATRTRTAARRVQTNARRRRPSLSLVTSHPSPPPNSPACNSICRRSEPPLTPPVNGTRGFAATIGAAVALGGFVVPAAGIAGSALNAFCSLVSFSITASLMNGDSTDGGAFNKEADCGLKSDGVDISGGGAFGLQIVSFLLGIVGAACFFLAQRDSSA